MVGLATSPLDKKVSKRTLPTGAGRVSMFCGAVGFLVTSATPVAQRDVLYDVVAAVLVGAVAEIVGHADFIFDHPLGGNAVSIVRESLTLLTTTIWVTSTGRGGISAAPEGSRETYLLGRLLEEFLNFGPIFPRHVCVLTSLEKILDNGQAFLPTEDVRLTNYEGLKPEPVTQDWVHLILRSVKKHHLRHTLVEHRKCLVFVLYFYTITEDVARRFGDAVMRPKNLFQDQALRGTVFTGCHRFSDLTDIDVLHLTLEG